MKVAVGEPVYYAVFLAVLLGLRLAWWLPRRTGVTRPQLTRILRAALPRRRWTLGDLRRWLDATRHRNACAKASHAKRRLLMLRKLSL